MNKIAYSIFALAFVACTHDYDLGATDKFIIDVPHVSDVDVNVEVYLTTGYLSASGKTYMTDGIIQVEPGVGTQNFQVLAHLNVPDGVDPELLRVIFTSDRVEYVATDGMDLYTYYDEDECLEEGYHCDLVVVAEGVSGYFDPGEGESLAVTNAYCAGVYFPYAFTVTAYVLDLSYPTPTRISEFTNITVSCEEL